MPEHTSSRKTVSLEILGGAVLGALGLFYLSQRLRGVTTPKQSPFDVGPFSTFTIQDEINFNMLLTRLSSKLEPSQFHSFMEGLGKLSIGQRKAIKMRLARQFSEVVKITIEHMQKTPPALRPEEMTQIINEIKAGLPSSVTIDEAKVIETLQALQSELRETPLEVIHQVLDYVIDNTLMPWIQWHEAGQLKEFLIAQSFIPEHDIEQVLVDGIKRQGERIKEQWKEVAGGQTWQERLEGAKANAEAEDILRPISREIKSLDYSEYDALNKEIESIRAIKDPAARLQEAEHFKTNYETNHKANAGLARERLRQEHEKRKNRFNPFRRR